MISSVANSVKDAVTFAVTSSVGLVNDSAKFCGRKFEDLTEAVLPQTAAKIAQKVVYGLPFAVASLFVPAYLQLAAFATYHIVHIVHDIAGEAGTLPFSHNTYQNLFTGLGTAHLFKAGVETLNLASNQKASIVSIAINLLFASLFISKATQSPSISFGSIGTAPQKPVVTQETPTVAPANV